MTTIQSPSAQPEQILRQMIDPNVSLPLPSHKELMEMHNSLVPEWMVLVQADYKALSQRNDPESQKALGSLTADIQTLEKVSHYTCNLNLVLHRYLSLHLQLKEERNRLEAQTGQ